MSAAPLAPRVLAAAGAALAGGFFLLAEPYALAQAGCPATATTAAGLALVFVAFLLLLAAGSGWLDRQLRARTRIDPADGAQLVAAIVLAAALFVALGRGGAVTAALTLEHAFGACPLGGEDPEFTAETIVFGVVTNLAVFTLPVLLYVSFVYGVGPAGVFRALGLRAEGAPGGIVLGLAAAVVFIFGLALLSLAAEPYLPEAALENERALQIAKSVTLGSAFILAVGSGVGEEVLFRGFLQPRWGIWLTSVVFAVAHVNYGSVSEVVVVFALSLALGYLFRRTGNLWVPIAAHFGFNMLMLLIGIYLVPPAA